MLFFLCTVMAIDSPFFKKLPKFFPPLSYVCVNFLWWLLLLTEKNYFSLITTTITLCCIEMKSFQVKNKAKKHYYDSHSCVLFISFCAKKHIVLLTYNTPLLSHLTTDPNHCLNWQPGVIYKMRNYKNSKKKSLKKTPP